MGNRERNILNQIDQSLPLLAAAVMILFGIGMRLPLMDFVSGDSQFCLLPWYEEIRQSGLSQQVGNYNLFYQFLIFLMTKLPLEPLHAYKWLSIFFDYLIATGALLLTRKLTGDNWKSILVFGAVLLCPITVLNSAAWAQCDSIYCSFALLALITLSARRYTLTMILMGLSFSFKLQAVFLLPLLLFVYYQRREFSIAIFLLIPLTMCLTGLPCVLFGRNILDIFAIYSGQTVTYPYVSMNYPSFWLLLAQERNPDHYALLQWPAIFLTITLLAAQMVCWLQRRTGIEGKNLVYMAFLLCYTCVLFLPAMHERYGFLYELLAVIIAFLCPATAPLCIGLLVLSMCTYGYYLFDVQVLPLPVLSVVNLFIFTGYQLLLYNKMSPTRERRRSPSLP